MVIYTFLCIVLLYITICLRCLKLILKKWEFKRLGYFPGQVTFQGLYGYFTVHISILAPPFATTFPPFSPRGFSIGPNSRKVNLTFPSSLLYWFWSAILAINQGAVVSPLGPRRRRRRPHEGRVGLGPWVNPERLRSARGGQGHPRGAGGMGGKWCAKGGARMEICRVKY